MIYAKVAAGVVVKYPITETDVRQENKNTSFPAGSLSPSIMLEFNCVPVTAVTATFDPATQRAVEGLPEQVGSSWQQVWNIVDLTAEEISARNAAQWAEVRADRNALLAACDWTQLADGPVDPLPWITYRQDLRDITLQADPFNLTWPVAPQG